MTPIRSLTIPYRLALLFALTLTAALAFACASMSMGAGAGSGSGVRAGIGRLDDGQLVLVAVLVGS